MCVSVCVTETENTRETEGKYTASCSRANQRPAQELLHSHLYRQIFISLPRPQGGRVLLCTVLMQVSKSVEKEMETGDWSRVSPRTLTPHREERSEGRWEGRWLGKA